MLEQLELQEEILLNMIDILYEQQYLLEEERTAMKNFVVSQHRSCKGRRKSGEGSDL